MTKQERIEKKQKEIEKQKEKLEKLAQQLKVLNQPTQKERKARTHRLCILGGVVEKFLKNTNKDLSNEEISQYLSELLQKADTGEKEENKRYTVLGYKIHQLAKQYGVNTDTNFDEKICKTIENIFTKQKQ